MKIVSTGSTLSSSENYKKKKKQKQRKLVMVNVSFIIFLIGIIFVARLSALKIKNYIVEGARVITEENVVSNVRNTIAGEYLWLIPRSNSLIFPRSQVEKNLLMEFPRFSSVNLSLDGVNTLIVSVVEREPFQLYCASVNDLANASSCYFLDEEGFIFDDAPAFSGVVYFVYAHEVPLESPKGQAYLPAQEFKNLTQFINNLKLLWFKPLAVEASKNEYKIILPAGARVVLSRELDVSKALSNLEAFLNDPTIKSQADFKERVLLLDLRTANKVFYRFHE